MFAAVKESRLSRAPAGFFAELLGPTGPPVRLGPRSGVGGEHRPEAVETPQAKAQHIPAPDPTEQDESLRCASAQVKNWGVRPLLLPPGTQKFERTTLGSRSFIVVRIYVR